MGKKKTLTPEEARKRLASAGTVQARGTVTPTRVDIPKLTKKARKAYWAAYHRVSRPQTLAEAVKRRGRIAAEQGLGYTTPDITGQTLLGRARKTAKEAQEMTWATRPAEPAAPKAKKRAPVPAKKAPAKMVRVKGEIITVGDLAARRKKQAAKERARKTLKEHEAAKKEHKRVKALPGEMGAVIKGAKGYKPLTREEKESRRKAAGEAGEAAEKKVAERRKVTHPESLEAMKVRTAAEAARETLKAEKKATEAETKEAKIAALGKSSDWTEGETRQAAELGSKEGARMLKKIEAKRFTLAELKRKVVGGEMTEQEALRRWHGGGPVGLFARKIGEPLKGIWRGKPTFPGGPKTPTKRMERLSEAGNIEAVEKVRKLRLRAAEIRAAKKKKTPAIKVRGGGKK